MKLVSLCFRGADDDLDQKSHDNFETRMPFSDYVRRRG